MSLASGLFIFSDASFQPKTGKGVCAYLVVRTEDLLDIPADESRVQIRTLEGENIARLEFLSAIHALRECSATFGAQNLVSKITLVTDCKGMENLLSRRERLERVKFMSGKKGTVLSNADLYKKFLVLYDELLPKIVWVKGHAPKASQTQTQKYFSLVDRAARRMLSSL